MSRLRSARGVRQLGWAVRSWAISFLGENFFLQNFFWLGEFVAPWDDGVAE